MLFEEKLRHDYADLTKVLLQAIICCCQGEVSQGHPFLLITYTLLRYAASFLLPALLLQLILSEVNILEEHNFSAAYISNRLLRGIPTLQY